MRFPFMVALVIAVMDHHRAHGADEIAHWRAFSLSARSITGDIDISNTRVVFEGGAKLSISYIGNSRGVALALGDPVASVFRIGNLENIELLHGNKLCATPATYLTYVTTADPILAPGQDMLFLTLIIGSKRPDEKLDRNRICASYAFTRARSDTDSHAMNIN